MTIDELRARLRAIESRIIGKNPRATVVLNGDDLAYITVRSDFDVNIVNGELGRDLDALLTRAAAAVEEHHPDTLARTLGMDLWPLPEPAPVAAE